MENMLRSLGGKMVDYVTSAFSGAPPYEVQEIDAKQLQKCQVVCTEESMTLYKDGNGTFFSVLYMPKQSNRYFCLFRLTSDSEAMTTFSAYGVKLQPLCLACKSLVLKESLQQACEIIREHPSWGAAHVAASLNLPQAFRSDTIAMTLALTCDVTGVSPIMVAIEKGHTECVKELLVCGVPLTLADRNGDNVFHYAAKLETNHLIQMLASRDTAVINQLNVFGESALHTACLLDRPDNVEQLLRWRADPTLSMSGRYPIHCAMKVSSHRCVETLCRWNKSQIHFQDKNYGGTPLHWAKSQQCVYTLADLVCNLEATNKDGETALLIMIQRNRMDCVMALLSRGAKATAIGVNGNTALHLCVPTDNVDMMQALVVFGADVNRCNNSGDLIRHTIVRSPAENKDVMLYLVHRVGASRCLPGTVDCLPGCIHGGSQDGMPPSGKPVVTPTSAKQDLSPHSYRRLYDSIVDEVAIEAALTRSASASGSSIMTEDHVDSGLSAASSGSSRCSGDRVLCLDGGGIRGLVLIQLLIAMEEALGQPIRTCFDWIGGTSTGGILALALVHGKSIHYCQGLYLRLKDEVFVGKRPYNSEPLERFMKREFGENVLMTEVEYPRVLVTGVLGDRHPAELHFFRNYDPPGHDYTHGKRTSTFVPPPRPNEQYVWKAARSSGAAPTYFRSMGRFVDGGLIANNPTLDVLTEIHEYNMGLKAMSQGSLVKPLHVVVSLGTGKIPIREVKAVDVFRPEGVFDITKVIFGASNLAQLLVDQATQSEGRPVDRARAWLSMIDVPYFRFSPQLTADIPLDCNDEKVLIQMMWETQCYIHDNWERFLQLARVLKS